MLTTFSQGTRSIIDNLDTGTSVVPILTRYEGVADCFSTILQVIKTTVLRQYKHSTPFRRRDFLVCSKALVL